MQLEVITRGRADTLAGVSDPEILASQQNDASFEDVWEELNWRGLVHVSTDPAALKELLAGEPITYYCGFDPTAPSLHLGNLVQILTMRRLQLAGHKPLGLVGGSTGLIGDPRPTAERTLNTKETVAEWVDDEMQASMLRDWGVTYLQGHLVGQAETVEPLQAAPRRLSAG